MSRNDSQSSPLNSPSIPKGYKQTEAGVVPQDWEVKPFTQVTDLITCGIAATPDYVPDSQGYPFSLEWQRQRRTNCVVWL